jgi:hypothetical protein
MISPSQLFQFFPNMGTKHMPDENIARKQLLQTSIKLCRTIHFKLPMDDLTPEAFDPRTIIHEIARPSFPIGMYSNIANYSDRVSSEEWLSTRFFCSLTNGDTEKFRIGFVFFDFFGTEHILSFLLPVFGGRYLTDEMNYALFS